MHRFQAYWTAGVTAAAVVVLGLGTATAAPAQVDAAAQRVITVAGLAAERAGVPGRLVALVCCRVNSRPAAVRSTGGCSTCRRGRYEYKVTVNRGWDENYGAGGVLNGANIPLRLEGPAKVQFSYDDTSHVVTVKPVDLAGPTVTAADKALATPSLRQDLTKERFYFLMADRFANGNKANDAGGLTGDRLHDRAGPDGQGLLPRWRPGRRDAEARLHQVPRYDVASG